VYVSDYSRYLPKSVSAPRTFWAVFGGNVIGTCLYAGFGIYITAVAPAASPVTSIGSIAGKWILPILALESVRSTFQQVTASRTARLIGLLIIFAIATVLAKAGYKTFLPAGRQRAGRLAAFASAKSQTGPSSSPGVSSWGR
jgi:purine-cytosine permease-like protein